MAGLPLARRRPLALGELEMAIWARRGERLNGLSLIHRSDRGVQCLAIRYTERLAAAGVAASVGSRGDSYDNALAESFNGLYKTKVIAPKDPGGDSTTSSTPPSSNVDWFNQRRLHGEIGMIPPAEFDALYDHQGPPALLAVSQ